MEHLKEKPYIGVTGITLPIQAEAVARTFVDEGLTEEQSSHKGMIGVLVSQRTLLHPSQPGIKHPALDQIGQIFETTKGMAFNTLHYHTYREDSLALQLEELLDQYRLYSNRLCDGVQLNMFWPPVTEVEKTRIAFPDLKIILQLGPQVLTEQPQEIAANLAPYIDLIDCVLIDPSGGKGKVFKINKIAPAFNQIKRAYPDLPLAFAGGFHAENVQAKLWLLFQTVGTTNFGIDAENGLRVQRRKPSPLSITRACRYIQNAALFFKKYPH